MTFEMIEIRIDLHQTYQRWDGFGSSILSWLEPHPEIPVFKNVPRDALEQAMRMAYTELGMTRARFFPRPFHPDHEWDKEKPTDWTALLNLEAGDCDGYVDTVLDLQNFGLRDWYPCFQVDGRVPGGPPPWMRPGHNFRSLTADTYDTYLDLLMLLTRHWRNKYGVEPSYWSLCNEPTYAPSRPLQISLDGMLYLVKTLGRRLRAEGFGTRIVMPDDWTPEYTTVAYAEHVLADPEARSYVAGVAFHGYDGYEKPYLDWRVFDLQREWRCKLREVCSYYNAPAWQTESTSIEPGKDVYDDALFQANHIYDDMVYANAAAWDYMWGIWQSEWHIEQGWGVQSPVYIRFDEQGQPTDIFYTELGHTMGHWSRAIHPGAVRIEAESSHPEVRVTAFRQGEDITVTVINNDPQPVTAALQVNRLAADREVIGYTTTEGHPWQTLNKCVAPNGNLQQGFAGRSITTLTLSPTTPIHITLEPADVMISVDESKRKQTITGFGGTLFNWREEYWEVPHMAHLPQEIKEEAMRLAHQELGLTIARTFPRAFPGDDGRVQFEHPACDGIADTIRRSQVYGLKTLFGSALIRSTAKTPVPQISRDWLEANGRTLRADCYPAYADHVVDFVRHWRDDLGIDLVGWSLDRSPSAPATLPQTLTPDGARILTRVLGRALGEARLNTKVLVAADVTPARHGIAFARAILSDDEARAYVLAAEFHGRDGYQGGYNNWRYFNGQRQSRTEFADVCKAYSIPTWQTESLTVRPAPTVIADAMLRANHIHDDLTYGEASVWLYRWLVWEGDWNATLDYTGWGPGAPVMVYFDEQNRPERVEIAKLGDTMGQWSRWVRPGAQRILAYSTDPFVRVTAFTGPEVGKTVLVIINNHDQPINAEIKLDALPTKMRCYRTSEFEAGATVDLPTDSDGQLYTALLSQSVTTLIIWSTSS
jgi:O-glycosyl hydrolase